MKAYVIAQIDITDPETFKAYQQKVPATIDAFGGRYLVRGGTQEMFEGEAHSSRTVIVEFPDTATAKAWYASDDYADPLATRLKSATGTLTLVEGYAG